jgi:hypothetical protein
MRLPDRYTYECDGVDVEVEVRITGEHEVEIADVVGFRDSSGNYIDVPEDDAAKMVTAANEAVMAECAAGEWDLIISEASDGGGKPERPWGHHPWVPGVAT